MSGHIHGNGIRTEAGDAVIFRCFVEQVTSCCMVKYTVKISDPDVVRP